MRPRIITGHRTVAGIPADQAITRGTTGSFRNKGRPHHPTCRDHHVGIIFAVPAKYQFLGADTIDTFVEIFRVFVGVVHVVRVHRTGLDSYSEVIPKSHLLGFNQCQIHKP